MIGFTPKFNSLRIGWNERPLTEGDFLHLCKRFRIRFSMLPLRRSGYYTTIGGRDHIVVSTNLREFQMLFVMFHELGHYLMHGPAHGQTARFSGSEEHSREENEADAFAYCSLLPLRMLEDRAPDELIEVEGFETSFLLGRLAIYERYRI